MRVVNCIFPGKRLEYLSSAENYLPLRCVTDLSLVVGDYQVNVEELYNSVVTLRL